MAHSGCVCQGGEYLDASELYKLCLLVQGSKASENYGSLMRSVSMGMLVKARQPHALSRKLGFCLLALRERDEAAMVLSELRRLLDGRFAHLTWFLALWGSIQAEAESE